MININGQLVSSQSLIFSIDNRGFKYGDAVFETMKILDSKIVFFEEHYFRLMASLHMMRMNASMKFTLEYVESEILNVVEANNLSNGARVRLTVYRKDGGLYTPKSNDIDFVIEVSELKVEIKEKYEVELYKDFYVYSGLLSTIKSTNRSLNVIASIFAKENDFDTCILINEKKQVVEAIYGNIFIIMGNTIVTPPLSEGCIKGVIRGKIISLIKSSSEYIIEERAISPFELKKADEVFITNSIIDIQPVTNYRKKTFKVELSTQIDELLKKEYN